MNKKAIMIKFLVTVLLALLIFAPACIFTSNLFRLSTQASQNFDELAKEINELDSGAKSNFLLIMDEKSYIAKFDKDSDILFHWDFQQPSGDVINSVDYKLKYPLECARSESKISLTYSFSSP